VCFQKEVVLEGALPMTPRPTNQPVGRLSPGGFLESNRGPVGCQRSVSACLRQLSQIP
jgi:hypothetical protein